MRLRPSPHPADAETMRVEQTIALAPGDILEIVDVSGWDDDDHTLVDDLPYGSDGARAVDWLSGFTPV